MEIVFVVLHYKVYQDTVECVRSIRDKIDTKEYHIIIVDNASGNGSGEKLEQTYPEDADVTVIMNKENLGFSNGLNTGIFYARQHWNTDYIVAINNDTLLINDDFVSVLRKKYERYGFSVAGPMMITKDGKCCVNPIRNTPRTAQDAQHSIERYKRLVRLCDMRLYGAYSTMVKRKKKKPAPVGTVFLTDQVDYKLHGACLIFSRRYFEVFDGLDPSTFLYGEEDILYLHLMRHGMKTLYTPDLVIYHKEDSSTEASFADNTKKMKFVSENCIKSLETYIDIFRKYETEGKEKPNRDDNK